MTCCPTCGQSLASDRSQAERLERRDAILRELAARHFRRPSVNAAASLIAEAARTYFAGADFRLAKINGAVQPGQEGRPPAAFFEIYRLGAEVPSARQLRRILLAMDA